MSIAGQSQNKQQHSSRDEKGPPPISTDVAPVSGLHVFYSPHSILALLVDVKLVVRTPDDGTEVLTGSFAADSSDDPVDLFDQLMSRMAKEIMKGPLGTVPGFRWTLDRQSEDPPNDDQPAF